MLGHRSSETTKEYYLEPFRTLDLELLMHHAQQAAVEGFLASYWPTIRLCTPTLYG